ncbi:MAG: ATP-binding protein [candidate division Zixibacteria bacterium]|nr:ATP-binding protein [candidate division Zixibacteria bacterium]
MAKQPKVKKLRELSFSDINYRIAFKPPRVRTSNDVEAKYDVIGQGRAIEAIKMGLSVQSIGYNIFVTGFSGTGRSTTIKHLLEQLEHKKPELNDVCYVNNFKNVDNPRVVIFKAGEGKRFKKDMGYLIDSIRKVVPKVFLSEDYKDRNSRVVREYEARQKKLINTFEEKLTAGGFVMVQIQSGMGTRNEIQPLIDNEPASLEKLERLSKEGKFAAAQLDELRRTWDSLRREFDQTTIESKKLSAKLEDAIDKLNNSMIAPLVTDKVNLLRRRYPHERALVYLDEVEQALTEDLDRYKEAQPRRGDEEAPVYRKREPFEEFSVNLILDNSETTEVPIIIEKFPSYKNMFGSLERVVDRFGYWRTDFTRIFSGSMLKASGGFLVINALDLLTDPATWVPLKRALRNGEMEITGGDAFYMMAGSSIKPEPVPLNVKVVLIGESYIYRLLLNWDEDFRKVFKVKAEFDHVMPLNDDNMEDYFRYIKRVIEEEKLPPFDLSGMQAVIEYGRRMAGHREKLTTRFTAVADIIREAAFTCVNERSAGIITRDDVYTAIQNMRTRVNLIEDKIQELFDSETLMVSSSGSVVGQINGLSVYNLGDHAFGRPTRITVSTSWGKAGIINIERESDLSGPIHNKGVLVLGGYLRSTFAQNKPLVLSASISFEQSYSGVDGDSASSTEMYCILSSLANLPINQSIAVTGSMNQRGEIQPVGGVNEKIEGFFDVCKARGLSGVQGVMIPHQNVADLLLRPDVVEAVKNKKFHIYPVETISHGIGILTGIPGGMAEANGTFSPGSVLQKVDEKLHTMAIESDRFGRDVDDKKKAEKSKNGDCEPVVRRPAAKGVKVKAKKTQKKRG